MVLVILVLLIVLLLYYRSKRSSDSLLPPTVSATRHNATSGPWTWETSALCLPHDALTEYLASASRADGAIPRGLVAFYDAGTFIGLGAMVASMGLLLWTLFSIARDLLALAVLRPTSPVTTSLNSLISRAMSPSTTTSTAPSSELSLQLLIPGLTTPLSDAPLLILALLLAQAIHEFGHALSAALPLTPATLHRIGISLRGAYVALIPHQRATPWASMRIACAGAWHNVVLGLVLWMATQVGVNKLMRSTLFPQIQGEGLIVFDVERYSPLNSHLERGALVTHLDDVHLDASGQKDGAALAAMDIWTKYLLQSDASNESSQLSKGWCISQTLLADAAVPVPLSSSTSPCSKHLGTALFSPFPSPSLPSPSDSHCLDPLPVFKSSARCSSTTACPATEACIAPAPSERLMRIAVREVDHSHLIVWRGPKREVFDQVIVRDVAPRWPFIPLGLLLEFETLFSYLSSLTLMLALVNMLPIRALDGGSAFSAFLDSFVRSATWDDLGLDASAESNTLELGEGRASPGSIERRRGPRRSCPLPLPRTLRLTRHQKERLEEGVSVSVTMLACVVLVGLFLSTLLNLGSSGTIQPAS